MPRIPSVVHAIQPCSCSSDVSCEGECVCLFRDGLWSSRSGISCTPMENNGRKRCGGEFACTSVVTARGILESTERLYTSQNC